MDKLLQENTARFLAMKAADGGKNQESRMKSAASAELTPISVSIGEESGIFGGSHGQYVTTLTSCQCQDFHSAQRRGVLPCKHMYRLAHELGVIELPGVVSDACKIKQKAPTSKERALAEERCKSRIRSYPEETRRELWQVLAARYKKEPYVCEDMVLLSLPLADGMLEYEDRAFVIQSMSKKQVVDSLEKKGFVFPPEAGKTQKERHAWCAEHAEEVCTLICPAAYTVKPSGDLEIANRKVYSYLRDEFYIEPVYYF